MLLPFLDDDQDSRHAASFSVMSRTLQPEVSCSTLHQPITPHPTLSVSTLCFGPCVSGLPLQLLKERPIYRTRHAVLTELHTAFSFLLPGK